MSETQVEPAGDALYRSSPIKRARRTAADMNTIRQALYDTLAEDHPASVRQVFYRLTVAGVIAKTEQEYKGTVCRLLSEMRKDGQIPYEWISDSTRWMRKSPSYGGLAQALRRTVEAYRRSVWDEQAVYVEVWLEKDALAGVLMEVTDPWDVPLMVTRGYSSLSFLHSAAEEIAARGKPAFLYHFGDYDPSGTDIPRAVEEGLREMAPAAEIHFQRVAVTPAQITAFHLPTRPTKQSDSRSGKFRGESVEVDALPPHTLRGMAEACILRHINPHTLSRLRETERLERETLAAMVQDFGRRTR